MLREFVSEKPALRPHSHSAYATNLRAACRPCWRIVVSTCGQEPNPPWCFAGKRTRPEIHKASDQELAGPLWIWHSVS